MTAPQQTSDPAAQSGASTPPPPFGRVRTLLARAFADPRAVLDLRAPVIAAAATLLTVLLANRYSRRYERNVVDDAMISIRYAENLALGNGLVFNPGERVEGYTNFLWTVLLAPLYWLARLLEVDHSRLVIHANMTCAAVAMVLTYTVGRRLWGNHWLATLAALGVLALDNAFVCWAVFGLETHLLAVWLLAALHCASLEHPRRGLLTGICLALAQMTRPDAALFSVALIASELVDVGVAALRRETRAQVRPLLGQLAWLVLALVALYGAYFAWRYRYYGFFFPNTYYVKLGGGEIDAWERGRAYVREFFELRDWWLLPALGAALSIHKKLPRALVLYLPVHFLYVAYAGGDFFSGHRLLVPQLPLMALCIGEAVATGWRLLTLPRVERALARWAHPAAAFAGAAAVVVAFGLGRIYKLGLRHGPLELEVKAWGHDLSANRQFFRWLREHKPPGATIATGLIGHTAVYGDLPVYDLFGIVNPEIAHREVKNFGKGKAGHEKKATLTDVLAHEPTYIVGGYVDTDYWSRGYFWFNEVPVHFVKRGLWQKDELAETGAYLAHTRIDFESLPDGTTLEGAAFELGISRRPGRGQTFPHGVSGAFLSSYHPTLGDTTKGRFRSAPFPLEGDLLVLRVGGGHDPERLRVSLLVDGREVAHATGRDDERLGRRVFEIAAHRGRNGVLEVNDDADWAFGHLVVDEVVQWKKR